MSKRFNSSLSNNLIKSEIFKKNNSAIRSILLKKLKIKNLKEKILYIATLGGAKCLGIDNQVGSIQENKKADLIGFKITQKNPLNSILYDGGKNINLRMIDGKII